MSPTLSTMNFHSEVSYRSLHQATNGFSPSMLLGTGSFGSVYKGNLDHQEENLVAIKVLNLHQKGASKSFIAECNALRNIRHRNLVKILTCCSSIDYNGKEFKALIFPYVLNGSLEMWLNPMTMGENQSMSLSLVQRLSIAADVASAVCYLHHHCDQPIIHCDLKPSNVLLDDEMIAHVSDFGLARLIVDDIGTAGSETSTIGIKGTIGYAPPATSRPPPSRRPVALAAAQPELLPLAASGRTPLLLALHAAAAAPRPRATACRRRLAGVASPFSARRCRTPKLAGSPLLIASYATMEPVLAAAQPSRRPAAAVQATAPKPSPLSSPEFAAGVVEPEAPFFHHLVKW